MMSTWSTPWFSRDLLAWSIASRGCDRRGAGKPGMPSLKLGFFLRSVAVMAVALAVAPLAGAMVAERVVAVVGEHAILLSDMRQRARPFLSQIQQRVPVGGQERAAGS